MAIRLSGLASGMDTESIINALMEAKKVKKTKIENKQTKLEWKQEIWKSLNTKVYDFYKDYAGKLRFQTNYQTKKATSSDTTKVTATAASGAAKGSYTVEVQSLAASQYVTGAKVGKYTTTDAEGNPVEKSVTNSTKLSDLGFATDGSSQIQVTAGNKKVALNVDANTTVKDFVTTLQDAGLNASFDEKQGRFFISSRESGKDNGFTITTHSLSSDQTDAKSALLEAVNYDSLSSSQKSTVKSLLNTLQNSTAADKTTTVSAQLQEMVNANAKTKATNYYKEQKTAELTEKYLGDDGATITADGLQLLEDAGKTELSDEEKIKYLQKQVTTETNTYMKSDEAKEAIQDAVDNGLVNDEGDILIENETDRTIAIQSAVDEYAEAIEAGTTADSSADTALKALGLGQIDGSAVAETSAGQGMVVIAAADSVVKMNGATLTSSSTTLEVNGLTLNLTGETEGQEVKVTVADDQSAVYDSVKEFINEYNSILADLNKYFYASSAKDYDILTDEEKESMSEEEVEKWEDKIKGSLLRRDSTLGGVLETLKTTMTGTTITASNGKKYSLANLGITTGSDYKEYGLLHIKGDEDDTEYADETNKLENLLNEDPDVVAEVLSGITTKLYDNLSKKMRATTMSSALTFYNDKEMNSQLSDYKKEISDWEDKLADLEDRYYAQFAAMETAMSKLNSQQNIFTNYL